MRIALVNSLNLSGGRHRPQPLRTIAPMGLLSLAATARRAGHAAAVVDPTWELVRGAWPFDADLYTTGARAILDRAPDVVGFTTWGPTFLGSIQLARKLRALAPDLPIVMGGPHATLLHRQILDALPFVVATVRGEAENSLPALLDALEAGRDLSEVPGTTWRQGSAVITNPCAPLVEDLDSLPTPAWADWGCEEDFRGYVSLEAGRGCPFSCTFCSTSRHFSQRFRLKSVRRLLHEMDALHDCFGTTSFDLVHDCFTVRKDRLVEFCDAVAERGYQWTCSARIDTLDRALLEHMTRAGCTGIYFGVETGSPRLQRELRKRLKIDQVEQRRRELSELRIKATFSFICGFPQETEHDLRDTFGLMEAIITLGDPSIRANLQLHRFQPHPGIPLLEDGGVLEDLARDEWLDVQQADFDDVDLIAQFPVLFPEYRRLRTVLPRDLLTIARVACSIVFGLDGRAARALLRLVPGGLWTIVAHARDRAAACGQPGKADLARVAEALLELLPPSAGWLHSWIRLTVLSLWLQRSSPDEARGGPLRDEAMVLSPHALVVDDLHHVAAIGRLMPPDGTPPPAWICTDVAPTLLFRGTPDSEVSVLRLSRRRADLLAAFRAPRRPHDVLAGLPAAQRGRARRLLTKLAEAGVLARAADVAAVTDPHPQWMLRGHQAAADRTPCTVRNAGGMACVSA